MKALVMRPCKPCKVRILAELVGERFLRSLRSIAHERLTNNLSTAANTGAINHELAANQRFFHGEVINCKVIACERDRLRRLPTEAIAGL